jgi:hypothetical protein
MADTLACNDRRGTIAEQPTLHNAAGPCSNASPTTTGSLLQRAARSFSRLWQRLYWGNRLPRDQVPMHVGAIAEPDVERVRLQRWWEMDC